ncbi:5420_t:CDS:2 [Funneliformis geosporum]|uniref:6124_t:CDS:1 n=1 Tax=Funneliformis geosporum TaxID=1117311 RepID=A0A9W4WMY5_9GLOM|nr:5420_t:CDS:2 [Funneliformis geosporum]CAI2173928.1 6124_t:CDS:2 [Funneliformis geosporum]
MSLTKYDGNIHPDEWINNIHNYFMLNNGKYGYDINMLVDTTINIPTRNYGIEEIRKALKEDVSFSIFKNANKRKLQLLKYIPEREGGDTLKFISNFRKMCYNAEIDLEGQKKYLYQSLPNSYFLTEFFKRKEAFNSTDELIKGFEEIIIDESNLIRNESIIALKHVVTGRYLSSIEGICYATGSKSQAVFVGNLELEPNGMWIIKIHNPHFTNKELASYTNNTTISLQHKSSNKFLGIHAFKSQGGLYLGSPAPNSPSTGHTEDARWSFGKSKLENNQGYLKPNDIINLSTTVQKQKGCILQSLRSHDFQFNVEDDSFQEVVCHNERLGGNDEVRQY